jgi:hypothetical protein
MTSTALQKPWMKDLPLPVISLAKKKAVEATAAWNATVVGVLTAAKAVYEVREKIGGKGAGSFSAWAEEELKRSQSTASCLAVIGARHPAFINALINLPSSWGTLYELAKAPDDVFKRALRRVKPDMERNEVMCLVLEETADKPTPRQEKRARGVAAAEATEVASQTAATPTPRQAANLTIAAGSLWRLVKDFADDAEEALTAGALSPEAKKFMVHNYIGPSRELLTAIEEKALDAQKK